MGFFRDVFRAIDPVTAAITEAAAPDINRVIDRTLPGAPATSMFDASGRIGDPSTIYEDPVGTWKNDVYQPSKELWNASVQPVFTGVSDAAYDSTKLMSDKMASSDLPGTHMTAKGLMAGAPASAEEIDRGKPLGTFAERFGLAAQTLPDQVEPYAQQIATTALSFVPGVGWILAPAFNTAMNAGIQQNAVDAGYQDKFDWGKANRDAAMNFGTALLNKGISTVADKAVAANNASGASAQTASSYANAFDATPGYTPGSYTSNLVNVGQSTAPSVSALSAFNPSSMTGAATTLSAVKPSFSTNVANVATNATAGIAKNLGQEAIATGLGAGTGITGATSDAPLAQEGGLTSPAGQGNKSAFSAFYTGDNTFDQGSYDKMLQAIMANATAQQRGAMDQFRDNGRWELSGGTDTAFGSGESDRVQNLWQTINDSSTEFTDRAVLAGLERNNPQYYTGGRDTNYWLNQAASGNASQGVMDAFGPYIKYAKPMTSSPISSDSLNAQPLSAKGM